MAHSLTHFSMGDEVCVYYDGTVLGTFPGQVNSVYAVPLRTPAHREVEDEG